jgi:predicted CoA-binding protein
MAEKATPWITEAVVNAQSIHILGAGLNSARPAHQAIHDLDDRGWRLVPIHPRDAGSSILGRPIRPSVDEGIIPDIVVLFLAPQRAKQAVTKMLMQYPQKNFPVIWFQIGALDDDTAEMLEQSGRRFVSEDCIVRYITRNDLYPSLTLNSSKWFRQISDEDGSGCSVWQAFSADAELMITELEWVGDLLDLEQSQHTIARYIRSLQKNDETLLETAIRLT